MLGTRGLTIAAAGLVLAAAAGLAPAYAAEPPKVGDKAKDFTLTALDGDAVALKDLLGRGPVALVVLRGYPGYQCPLCTRQVGELLGKAKEFGAAGARVVMVYPGPGPELRAKAREFVGSQTLPEGYELVLDPDYTFTDAYGLRWDAPKETAYPSTFVLDPSGTIRYAKVSRTHGDRAPAADVVQALVDAKAAR